MIKYSNAVFSFLGKRYSYIKNGKVVKGYADDIASIENTVRCHPFDYSKLEVEEVIPTKEQTARLKEVNDLVLEFAYAYVFDLSLYVEKGVMVNRCEKVKNLADISVENSKKFLIDLLRPSIKKIRNEFSIQGVSYKNGSFGTDDKTMNVISSYALKIANKKDDEVISFKDSNNEFIDLNNEDILNVHELMNKHISKVFKIEKDLINTLMGYSVEELLSFKETLPYYRVGMKEIPVEEDKVLNVENLYRDMFNK